MTGLINKNVAEVDLLINKYLSVLEVSNLKNINDYQLFAIIIDIGINYIKEKYNDINKDFKAICFIVLKHQINKIKTEDDVKKHIDDFINFYKKNYSNYIDNIEIFASEYDRDIGFINTYLK